MLRSKDLIESTFVIVYGISWLGGDQVMFSSVLYVSKNSCISSFTNYHDTSPNNSEAI